MMDNQIKQAKENITVKKWKRRIMEFNQNGMTVPGWCKVNNIGLSSFYKYQRQIRMELLCRSKLQAKSNYKTLFVPILIDIITGKPVFITKGIIKIEVYNSSDLE